MTCEEFEMAGLGLGNGDESAGLHDEALAHLRECAPCAALHENWQALRADLHALGAETQHLAAPDRVEMRLLQAHRTGHKTLKIRRKAVIASWAFAAAAMLVGMFSLIAWRKGHPAMPANQMANVRTPATNTNLAATTNSFADENLDSDETLVAINGTGEFTPLPGVTPALAEDATVVRVRMRRGTLGALGLAVNEERAADWIQVDLLVGVDGQPAAVRVPETSN